jgi:hypothetical protein
VVNPQDHFYDAVVAAIHTAVLYQNRGRLAN